MICLLVPVFGHGETQTAESTALQPTSAPQPQQAQLDQIVFTYQQHRLAFEAGKKKISAEVQEELTGLAREQAAVTAELEEGKRYLEAMMQQKKPEIPSGLAAKLHHVNGKISRYEGLRDGLTLINGASALALVSWAFVFGAGAEKLLFVLLPVTVLNIFLYLMSRQRESFIRHKKKLVIILVLAFVACATSLLAEPLDSRLKVEADLRHAEDMLKLTGNQKAIAILENKSADRMVLPSGLTSGNPELSVIQEVMADSPEYFFTLAALYTAEGRPGKAVEALTRIAEKKGLKGEPGADVIVPSVHFLVENGHPDIAGTLVGNAAALIDDTKTLLDLADYLKAHAMEVSSDHAIQVVLKKAVSPRGLVVLAEYFHAGGKKDKTVELLGQAMTASRSITDIILVAEACVKLKVDTVFHKLPDRIRAFTGTGTSEQYTALARIFHDQGQSIQAADCLQRAVQATANLDQLREVVRAVIAFKQGPVMDQARDRILSFLPGLRREPEDKRFQEAYQQGLKFVDFFIELKRQEDAAGLFDAIVNKIKEDRYRDSRYVALLIDCVKDALRRDLKKKAADIVTELTFTDPRAKAYSIYIPLSDDLLHSIQGVPDRGMVSVPLFDGLINEDINQLNEAENWYMRAVRFSLDTVNASYGDHVPDTLNQFYLLGRLWEKESRVEVLALLDRVYILLEQKMLNALKEKERSRVMAEPRARLAELKTQREKQLAVIKDREAELEKRTAELTKEREELIRKAEQELVTKQKTLAGLAGNVILKVVATMVIQLIMIGLVVGCGVLAWQYSQRLKEHRAYGFFVRFWELNGWLGVFSIVGAFSGFVLIFLSQLLQMLQKMHELALQGVTRADYAGVGVMPTGAAKGENQTTLTVQAEAEHET